VKLTVALTDGVDRCIDRWSWLVVSGRVCDKMVRVFKKLRQTKIIITLRNYFSKKVFFRDEKKEQKSPPIITEQTDADLIEGLYQGQSLTQLLAPMLKRVIEAALSGELSAHIASEKQEGVSNRQKALHKTSRCEV
jgi:hypothetical protein